MSSKPPSLDVLLLSVSSAISAAKSASSNPTELPVQHRMQIRQAAEALISATSTGEERIMGYWSILLEITVIRTILDWGVLDHIPSTPGKGIQIAELANKVGTEAELLARVLNLLIVNGFLTRTSDGGIAHTADSLGFRGDQDTAIAFQLFYDETFLPGAYLTKFFRAYGRTTPTEKSHNPHAFAHGEPEKNVWDIIASDKARQVRFSRGMGMFDHHFPVGVVYDFSWLKNHLGSGRALIVDVGGGKGHAIKTLHEANPWLPAEGLVLEDLKQVLDQVDDPQLTAIRKVEYDFFTEQPVKGACIYHIRRCLHDWSDGNCTKILKRMAEAMQKDSRLIINEQVIGDPPSKMSVQTDLTMFYLGGKERTEKMWRQLVATAGLRVKKFWKVDAKEQAMIECEKVE